MQNKLIINTVKYFLYFVCAIMIALYSITFNGCSGSDEEELVSQRSQDSINVYTRIQKAFTYYKKALKHNESSETAKAGEDFESSLKSLDKINYEIILKGENYFWKRDYDELATSIVQDYLITQSEISQQSLVFDFAKRVSLKYRRVEQVSKDREPLPDGSDVPLVRNEVVDGYIEFFSNTDRGRSFIDKSLYRSGKYFPIMRKILKFNNAPEELIYLSVQESGLNPTIVSRAGAMGLWQFMPATGISYGLGSDGYRDDRRDFEKSTDAASHLLKDLYKTYDDWYLAFAAYNAGPGRVNKAISKSGSRDFWTLRQYLPGETKNYVPSILALSFVLRNPEEYGFKDIEYGDPVSFDRVEIKSSVSLQRIAELCETDIETIRDLNSELTNDQVPVYDVPYELRIPHNSFDKFLANYNKADDIDKSSGLSPSFAGNEAVVQGEQITGVHYKIDNYEPGDIRLIGSNYGLKMVSHELKQKESLLSVALFYDVRPSDIRIWNNMNYGIYPDTNQKLAVYISDSRYNLLFGNKEKVSENIVSKSGNNDTDTDSGNNTEITAMNTENEMSSTTPESVSEDNNISKEKTNNTDVLTTDEIVKEETSVTETTGNETEVTESSVNETEDTYEETVSEEKLNKKTGTSKNTSFKTYTVSEGDNLTKIAADNKVTVEDLKEWNNLESDKITIGQKLKISSGKVKISVHTVAEGENLTMIANEYGISVSELKELNDLNSDVIYSGQKLKITGSKTKTSGKNSVKKTEVKKTYKVKKGDTLASIADKNDVSVKDLKQWNNIKGDKVMTGQVLKLYGDVQKNRKKK
ncbi:MAG: LysM peptidoglycan-binding domain-containing protein [Bacteroidetes bacterium]|nr:LysM peptidoglycan-binding domain-containing protein [Bacteroidota bacterium]